MGVLLTLKELFFPKNTEWHDYKPILFRPTSIDGIRINSPFVMRRKVEGKWEYREISEQQIKDFCNRFQNRIQKG